MTPPLRRFARLLIWQSLRLGRWLLPPGRRIRTRDRYLLEQVIFRELFLSRRYPRILFVGCAPYTSWYPWIFECCAGVRFETVEADPRNRRYGCRRHHAVGRLEDIAGDPERKGRYDLVILNGLFGFGTDDKESMLRVVSAAHAAARPGGTVLIGCNDLGGKYHFDPAWVDLSRFEKGPIPGIGRHDLLVPEKHRHRFLCFIKR